jgi:capsid portal protein
VLTLKTEAPKSVQKVEPKTHFIQKVISGDTYLVMAQSAIELEDEWSNLYYTTSDQSKLFLSPPFDPISLLNFTNTNNILKQCIEAMEVNIDGTGFSFVGAEEGTEPDETERKMAEGFFSEP